MLVRTEIALAIKMMSSARPRPASPTTKPTLKKRMMPRMVRMLGVKTPEKVPRPLGCACAAFAFPGATMPEW